MLSFLVSLMLVNSVALSKELDDLIKSQDVIVKKHLSELQEFTFNTEQNAAKFQSKAELIIENSKLNGKDLNLNCLNDLNLKEKPNSLATNLYVFGSLSMPKLRLIALIKEVNHYKGTLVLRGFKNNSYKETAAFLQLIIQEAGAGVIIDPILFSKYQITKVPVFVLDDPTNQQYDQITGNISLKYALEEFSKHGDLKSKALEILRI